MIIIKIQIHVCQLIINLTFFHPQINNYSLNEQHYVSCCIAVLLLVVVVAASCCQKYFISRVTACA